MKKTILNDIIKLIFGENPKKRFIHFIILTIIICVSLMLILNAGCGIKIKNFYFEWKPANVEIKKQL